MTDYMLPCLFKKFFGLPCPGCGGQRALLFLLKGDFARAFWMYPAIYPLLILIGLIILNYFYGLKQYSRLFSLLSVISVGTILINYGIEIGHILMYI